ncbi:MAG: lysozyme inhibitor LprI family protein [Sulfurimonas sp.]|jgi:uncharacterized protein YecT (DUF1311 family)
MKKLLPLLMCTSLLVGSSLMALDCRNASTTVDMKDCARIDYDKADKMLNAKYKQLMSLLPDAIVKDKLKKAQRAWIIYRDLSADFDSDAMRGGTGEGLLYVGSQTEMIEQRTKELSHAIEFYKN